MSTIDASAFLQAVSDRIDELNGVVSLDKALTTVQAQQAQRDVEALKQMYLIDNGRKVTLVAWRHVPSVPKGLLTPE
jgi:hypothetical protein